MPGKSKDEQIAEKKQELEKRLSDVNDKIGNAKKAPKKGKCKNKKKTMWPYFESQVKDKTFRLNYLHQKFYRYLSFLCKRCKCLSKKKSS